ncbi:hypothetical protein U9M48_008176 [Paspalum notatum var. saurae]|uniref:Uncharacterized protein n=1 Tax=Paspalum notatum var. saurae TaxID=547442 RepID=A0AAQ3WCY8_PASNO
MCLGGSGGICGTGSGEGSIGGSHPLWSLSLEQGLKCSVTASSPQQPSPTFTIAAPSLGSSLSSEHTVMLSPWCGAMLAPPSSSMALLRLDFKLTLI